MATREDLGRLAHAAYCDMVGRPLAVWTTLPAPEQAGWVFAATAVRDRLTLGISHAYRPEDDEPVAPEAAAPTPAPERRRRAPAAPEQ